MGPPRKLSHPDQLARGGIRSNMYIAMFVFLAYQVNSHFRARIDPVGIAMPVMDCLKWSLRGTLLLVANGLIVKINIHSGHNATSSILPKSPRGPSSP
jgi:hypothetical protein